MGAAQSCLASLGCGKVYRMPNRSLTYAGTLGEGAFSVVELVIDSTDGQHKALKVIDCPEPADVANAEKEAALYAKFNHPNIIPYVASAVIEMDGSTKVAICFPLFKGGTVQDRIDKMIGTSNHFPERELVQIFLGICKGIEEMHRQGYCHRDLKPANVLLDDDGTPVLMDFGSVVSSLTHIENRKDGLAAQGHAEENATLPYRSPELFNITSWPSQLTAKTDIWSLGCLLYTMAYHETPFEVAAGQTGSLPLAIAQGRYPYPESDPYSQQVRDLINSMLQLKPEERPSIDEVLTAIRKLDVLLL